MLDGEPVFKVLLLLLLCEHVFVFGDGGQSTRLLRRDPEPFGKALDGFELVGGAGDEDFRPMFLCLEVGVWRGPGELLLE